MPGKTGYEVAEYVKQTPALAHIPVVLLTGAFEPVDQAKATAAGCDGVLSKPFEPQIVIGRVRELLGRSASAAANEPASTRHVPVAQPASILDFVPTAHAPVEESPAPGAEARVEDYFDRLDAAFATLSNPSSPAPVAAAAPVPDEFDWLRPNAEQAPAIPQDFAIAAELTTVPATA